MSDKTVPLRPRIARPDELFLPEPGYLAVWRPRVRSPQSARHRKAVVLVGMRPDQVRLFHRDRREHRAIGRRACRAEPGRRALAVARRHVRGRRRPAGMGETIKPLSGGKNSR